jgi:chemotaxis protein MotB
MRTVQIFIIFSSFLFVSSCVTRKHLTGVQNELAGAVEENKNLKQRNIKLETANKELVSKNEQLSSANKDLSVLLEETLYKLNREKQNSENLENQVARLKQEMDLLKTGSSSEIEMLLSELQAARNDLIRREDKLHEAERELSERNSRLIELQNILAQKEQAVKDLKNDVMNALTGFNNNGLTVHEKNGKVYVSMDEKLLFKTGKWDVDPKGRQALNDLSRLLADNPDINIMVEGHTDNVPMHGSGEVKDNWDLSVMRSTAVTKILTQNKEIDPKRIIAAGRSEYIPLSERDTPEARQMNRRTEIILTPKLDELLKILDMNTGQGE